MHGINLNNILSYLCWCPRQEGVVEYGYFVMRYMKEIIDDPNPYDVKDLCLMK